MAAIKHNFRISFNNKIVPICGNFGEAEHFIRYIFYQLQKDWIFSDIEIAIRSERGVHIVDLSKRNTDCTCDICQLKVTEKTD